MDIRAPTWSGRLEMSGSKRAVVVIWGDSPLIPLGFWVSQTWWDSTPLSFPSGPWDFILFCCFSFNLLETRLHYAVQARLKFTLYTRLVLSLHQSPCLSLLSALMTDMHHHTQLLKGSETTNMNSNMGTSSLAHQGCRKKCIDIKTTTLK